MGFTSGAIRGPSKVGIEVPERGRRGMISLPCSHCVPSKLRGETWQSESGHPSKGIYKEMALPDMWSVCEGREPRDFLGRWETQDYLFIYFFETELHIVL